MLSVLWSYLLTAMFDYWERKLFLKPWTWIIGKEGKSPLASLWCLTPQERKWWENVLAATVCCFFINVYTLGRAFQQILSRILLFSFFLRFAEHHNVWYYTMIILAMYISPAFIIYKSILIKHISIEQLILKARDILSFYFHKRAPLGMQRKTNNKL